MTRPGQSLRAVVSAIGRDVVALQSALDEATDQALTRWGDEGIPPSGWAVRNVRLTFNARAAMRSSELLAGVDGRCAAVFRIGIRLVPVPCQ